MNWAIVALVLASSVAAAAPAIAQQDAAEQSLSPTMADLAGSAVNHFRAGRFEPARRQFAAALELAGSDRDRATLNLNLGSCLFELGRFGAAKKHFLAAADLDVAVRAEATLNAAAAALRAKELGDAEALVGSVSTDDPQLARRREVLEAEIAGRRREVRRAAFLDHVRQAETSLRAAQYANVKDQLTVALSFSDAATVEERVDVLYGLGLALLELDEPEAAQTHLQQALELAPQDADSHFAMGRARLAIGDDRAAEAHLQRALELGLDAQRAQSARTMLRRLAPLPPQGWHGELAAGAGYDSNPGQSGLAAISSLGNASRGGSPYGIAAVDLGHTAHWSRRVAGRFYYAGDWLGLWSRRVRELTLQVHSLGFRLDWVASRTLHLRFDAGPVLAFSGLDAVEPFVWEAWVGGRADIATSSLSKARVGLQARQIGGFEGWEFLGGTRLDFELSHAWQLDSFDLRAGVRARYNAIGTRVSQVQAGSIAACFGPCMGSDYRIPLGYFGVGPFLNVGVAPAKHLWIWGFLAAEQRTYPEESLIVGVDASRKRRQDQRLSAEVRVELPLDGGGSWRLVPSYGLLVSGSNVAYDPEDPDHAYDYDDRNYAQHFLELDLEISF